jgi:hypothetical protein
MKTKKLWLGMLILVLAFGMTIIGCGGGSDDPYVPPVPPPAEKDPLTGTVTITSEVTGPTYATDYKEKMTLTADTSGLNPTSSSGYSYQWQRNNTNINGATAKTYEVTASDFGQPLKVIVTNSYYTGSVEAQSQSTNHAPTVNVTVTIQYAAGAFKKEGVYFEKSDGTIIGSASASGAGATITLQLYNTVTQFKMREKYTNFAETKFYYKDGNASGPELFTIPSVAKTYTLTNTDGGFSVLNGLVATE